MPHTRDQVYSHETQHDQPLRLGPNSQHGFYDSSHAMPLGQPDMDDTQYNFSFVGVPEHGPVTGLEQAGFPGQHNSEFSHEHGMATSTPLNPHSMVSMPGMQSDLGADSSNHGGGLSGTDEGTREQNSPGTNSFDGGGGGEEYVFQISSKLDDTDTCIQRQDKAPAWSELKTKAGKERKRLPLACIACRRKKIRCSGEKPSCKHCLRSRIPCVYKVTTRKAAPRTDYMAMLDKRLKRMEDRVLKITPKPDERQQGSLSRAAVKPNMGTTPANKPSSAKKRGADEAFGSEDLEAWADIAADDGDANREAILQPAVTEHPSDDSVLFREGADALPSKEVQEHLAQVFFDNVYGQAYLLLHKPSYMRKLRNNTLPPVLVLSVCAVAARFSSDTGSTGTTGAVNGASRPFLRGEDWASHARDIVARRYEWPNTTILTCILILGLHEFGTCHGGRSWALGGQAIRMAFALQLHKDLDYEPFSRGPRRPLSFIDREVRRRIMWACFLMDRFNSSGSDRPMFIREETIQIQLPVKESLFQQDSPSCTEKLNGSVSQSSPGGTGAEAARDNMGVAAYTVRTIAIWGRIVSYLHQGGKEMDSLPAWNSQSRYSTLVQQIENLQQCLPAKLHYTIDNLEGQIMENTGSQFLLLHLSIQQSILFLHKAGVAFGNGSPTPDRPADFVSKATSKTVVAANKISEILKTAEQKECPVNAPFAGYCAFSATNIHIMGIFSGNATVKQAAEVYAGINIKFLRKTMRHWGMFHWMVEDIRTQFKRALEASRTGKMAPQLAANWPVLQYSDWFNRYPHGVSDYDAVEPTTQARKEKGDDAVLEQKPEMQPVGEFLSSTETPAPVAQNAPSKRKQSIKKSGEKGGTARRDSAVAVEAGPRPQSQPQAPPNPTGQPTTLVAQTSGPTAPPYTTAPIIRTHGQNYTTSVSPMSPVQMSPFPSQSAGQSPFVAPEMMHMASMQQRPAEMPANVEAQFNLGGYNMHPGAQSMPDSAVTWNDVHGQGPKMPQASQGHIAAEGLKDFSGTDLPAGWFMPFNMEPPEQDYRHHNGANGMPFAGFGPNGMVVSNLDGVQPSL